MPISIVTRAIRSSELEGLAKNLELIDETDFELLSVCKIHDSKFDGLNVLLDNANRFQARVIGVKSAKHEKVLFIDSDQIPENGLLAELEQKADDMVIIPEKSVRQSLVGSCLDDWRYRTERWARKSPNPGIPVVPRFYKRSLLLKALETVPAVAFDIMNHEDSILFNATFEFTHRISFSNHFMINYDPTFVQLLEKAFKYGKSMKVLNKLASSDSLYLFLRELDKSSLNLKELGIGKGNFLQLLRAISFKFGELL